MPNKHIKLKVYLNESLSQLEACPACATHPRFDREGKMKKT